MTKEERLQNLLRLTKAAAKAVAGLTAEPEITSDYEDDGEGPGVKIGFIYILPGEITLPSIAGHTRGQGWTINAEKQDYGTWNEPPTVDLIELGKTLTDWQAAKQAVLEIVGENIDNALDAATYEQYTGEEQ